MHDTLNFLGISGSLRRASYNTAALKAAQHLLPTGVLLTIFDLNGLALYNQDTQAQPTPRLVQFKQQIRDADAIVFATPEYNYSIPGVLKNALDCASRPSEDNAWAGKPVAILGASVSLFGSVRAQYHLRQMLVALKMFELNQPEVMIGNAAEAFDAQGNLISEPLQKLIRQLLQGLAGWTRQLQINQR